MADSCDRRNEASRSIKCVEFVVLGEDQLAS